MESQPLPRPTIHNEETNMRRLSNNPKYLIIHHTGGSDANPLADTSHHTFEIVEKAHRDRWEELKKTLYPGWEYINSLGNAIGYHYFISKNGKVTQGTPDNEEGIHCIGRNFDSLFF